MLKKNKISDFNIGSSAIKHADVILNDNKYSDSDKLYCTEYDGVLYFAAVKNPIEAEELFQEKVEQTIIIMEEWLSLYASELWSEISNINEYDEMLKTRDVKDFSVCLLNKRVFELMDKIIDDNEVG